MLPERSSFFSTMLRPPPSTLFPYTTLFRSHANFEKVYDQIKQRLTSKVIPVEIPVGEGPEFHGIINLFSKKCQDRKSTRLNSSHRTISYAVFCLKKKSTPAPGHYP